MAEMTPLQQQSLALAQQYAHYGQQLKNVQDSLAFKAEHSLSTFDINQKTKIGKVAQEIQGKLVELQKVIQEIASVKDPKTLQQLRSKANEFRDAVGYYRSKQNEIRREVDGEVDEDMRDAEIGKYALVGTAAVGAGAASALLVIGTGGMGAAAVGKIGLGAASATIGGITFTATGTGSVVGGVVGGVAAPYLVPKFYKNVAIIKNEISGGRQQTNISNEEISGAIEKPARIASYVGTILSGFGAVASNGVAQATGAAAANAVGGARFVTAVRQIPGAIGTAVTAVRNSTGEAVRGVGQWASPRLANIRVAPLSRLASGTAQIAGAATRAVFQKLPNIVRGPMGRAATALRNSRPVRWVINFRAARVAGAVRPPLTWTQRLARHARFLLPPWILSYATVEVVGRVFLPKKLDYWLNLNSISATPVKLAADTKKIVEADGFNLLQFLGYLKHFVDVSSEGENLGELSNREAKFLTDLANDSSDPSIKGFWGAVLRAGDGNGGSKEATFETHLLANAPLFEKMKAMGLQPHNLCLNFGSDPVTLQCENDTDKLNPSVAPAFSWAENDYRGYLYRTTSQWPTRKNDITFEEGVKQLKSGLMDQKQTEDNIHRLMGNTFRPEAAYFVAHEILDALSKDPNLSVSTKMELRELVSKEWEEVKGRFVETVITSFREQMRSVQSEIEKKVEDAKKDLTRKVESGRLAPQSAQAEFQKIMEEAQIQAMEKMGSAIESEVEKKLGEEKKALLAMTSGDTKKKALIEKSYVVDPSVVEPYTMAIGRVMSEIKEGEEPDFTAVLSELLSQEMTSFDVSMGKMLFDYQVKNPDLTTVSSRSDALGIDPATAVDFMKGISLSMQTLSRGDVGDKLHVGGCLGMSLVTMGGLSCEGVEYNLKQNWNGDNRDPVGVATGFSPVAGIAALFVPDMLQNRQAVRIATGEAVTAVTSVLAASPLVIGQPAEAAIRDAVIKGASAGAKTAAKGIKHVGSWAAAEAAGRKVGQEAAEATVRTLTTVALPTGTEATAAMASREAAVATAAGIIKAAKGVWYKRFTLGSARLVSSLAVYTLYLKSYGSIANVYTATRNATRRQGVELEIPDAVNQVIKNGGAAAIEKKANKSRVEAEKALKAKENAAGKEVPPVADEPVAPTPELEEIRPSALVPAPAEEAKPAEEARKPGPAKAPARPRPAPLSKPVPVEEGLEPL